MLFNGYRPLFASSLLGIVRILLEQTRRDEMRILGCNTLVDFIQSQVNDKYKEIYKEICNIVCRVILALGLAYVCHINIPLILLYFSHWLIETDTWK